MPIAGTVDEGDDVSGFRVVHLPGPAPGLIAQFRERDRLALASDALLASSIPRRAARSRPARRRRRFNEDTDAGARLAARSSAALGARRPPGRAASTPLRATSGAQLERAAAAA